MYELGKDHEDFRKVVREFATEAVEPHVAQWDRGHHFPVDLVPTMGGLGLFGLVVCSGNSHERASTSDDGRPSTLTMKSRDLSCLLTMRMV